jgi:glycosyltransferase involved in cell wall biosynthesis
MISGSNTSLSIGMIHFKAGDTDGVSLEMDKWREVFQSQGHTVHFCCGNPPMHADGCTVLPALAYVGEDARALNRGTFETLDDYGDATAYSQAMNVAVLQLTEDLHAWITSTSLDVLIIENIWSVGLHPAAAVALGNLVKNHNLHILAHHHDFYWERVKPVCITCKQAMQLVDQYLPPHIPGIKHVVINSKARQVLEERKGITADIIPNVFDFSPDRWQKDTYNADLRKAFGLKEEDVLILQATRVVRRKGIELAISFVQMLEKQLEAYRGETLYNGRTFSDSSNVVLVLAGSIDHDDGQYLAELKELARKGHVQLCWIGSSIGHSRTDKRGEKRYSLWDTYVHADLVSYPSYWEGWGNQLLEAVYAKVPIALFPYEIYESDIKPAGFSMIELGKAEHITWTDQGFAQLPSQELEQAASNACMVLFNRQARADMVESNFKIGEKEFSLATLQRLLSPYIAMWSKTTW